MSVRPVQNFPIDFYFLVDISASLENDLATIKSISQNISNNCSIQFINSTSLSLFPSLPLCLPLSLPPVDTIRSESTQFKIGFGTFVDKLTFPYVSNVQLRGKNRQYQRPISYVHNIGLTNDPALFIVRHTRTFLLFFPSNSLLNLTRSLLLTFILFVSEWFSKHNYIYQCG